MQMVEIVKWLNKLLTPAQIETLKKNNVPINGPNGIRRWLAERDIQAFVQLYFSDEFYLDFAPVHLDMLQDLQTIRDRQVSKQSGVKIARAYPRGHSKSSFYSRILPLHGFLYGWSKLTVLLANNDDAAKRLLSNIRNAIETNEQIKEDFPDIKGKQWGNERLESKDGNAIVGYGVGSGSIRGISNPYRPSLIIADDIDDDKSVRSLAELANNREWFDKSVLYLGDNVTYTTSFVVIGTIIRKTSLLQYILDSPDFNKDIRRAILSFSENTQLWEQWEQWILDRARNNDAPRDPESDSFYQGHKEELLRGTKVLWDRPDAYYRAMVSKLRNEKAFWSEEQNDPRDTETNLGTPAITDIPEDDKDYWLLAALDPTTKGGKNNDLAAYVEVLFNPTTKTLIVTYVDAKRRTYGATIDSITKRIKDRGREYTAFWVEINSAGTIIRDLLDERLSKECLNVSVDGIYSTLPKAERISTLSEYIRRGQLLFAPNLPNELYHELEFFPFAQTDDILDAISIIVLRLREKGALDLL